MQQMFAAATQISENDVHSDIYSSVTSAKKGLGLPMGEVESDVSG